jgi:hypothetical protein
MISDINNNDKPLHGLSGLGMFDVVNDVILPLIILSAVYKIFKLLDYKNPDHLLHFNLIIKQIIVNLTN